ncbi:DUF3990 domain-containing protein [Clostridium botulinum]|uniref:DUF3990 domain-containing protein n=2 Tax=Clostridium botulinum TaxID=1491 RepID=A0A0L9YCR5_CLOBO|nr:DUF3990 domain-containing protein [Clostridium botulinum]KAI3344163.1 DUF3990 domain-containing protein [Clostridium botulinum]KOM89647.1 hypothetical protein ACP51_00865 [Clostridium botulinum]KOR65626.1 hypothetical protein ADT22_00500 [Clostridium botulinum]MBN1049298.1 DUF3990 domain-containing protein [Clostridium botulinum]MBY7024828.1 DUF3990 domain-containing protein [Clostridium botulinum]
MIVYHGGIDIIEKPNIAFSKKYLDFGCGFYVTTYKEQAEKWAKRRGMRSKAKPIVNRYNLSDDLINYNIMNFKEDDELWLKFICNCRKGEEIYKEYDAIIGSVADDNVFKSVDMYFKGLWDEKRTLEEIKYYKMNNQICLVNQNLINNELKFIDSYEVK